MSREAGEKLSSKIGNFAVNSLCRLHFVIDFRGHIMKSKVKPPQVVSQLLEN